MKYFFSSLGLAAVAAAHGYVQNATIGGKEYEFYQPYQDPYTNPKPERVSRLIAGNGPVEDFSLADIQCGGAKAYGQDGSAPAALHADAAAGSEVELRWTLWPESHVGPVITYMAQCPDTGCNDWLPGTKAVWFKVKEEGRQGTSNTWAATPLMKAGGVAKYTIPECIKPGYYLVRHEIIALHASYQYPGAQAYPGCHQLKISGTGTQTPSTGLVSFPGAYTADTPGIVYDAYKAQEYPLPGPSVFSCSGGSGSGSTPKPSSAAPIASSAAPVSSARASSAPAAVSSASAKPTSVAVEGVSSTAAAPVATPTQGSSSSGQYNLESFIAYIKSRTDTPAEFSLQSFVSWLQEKPQAGSSSAASAPTSVGAVGVKISAKPSPTKGSNNGNAGGNPIEYVTSFITVVDPAPTKGSNNGNAGGNPVKQATSTLVTVVKPTATAGSGSNNGNGTPTKPSATAAPSSGTTTPKDKEYSLESFIAWLEQQEE